MLGYDANYKAAVEGNVYDTPDTPVRVGVVLPGNVYPDLSVTVESCEIDASLVTDMPDGTRFADGYPSVSCDLTLSGTIDTALGLSIADLINPYNTASPLYRQSVLGCNVTADVGIYETDGTLTWLRKFTGTIDTLTVDPVAGTVEFECIDYANKLRSLPDLPPVITAPPYNAGLTSEFAIDYLLRQATSGQVSSWPAQRPNCVLAVGLRASLWPEVGTLNANPALSTVTPVFAPVGSGSGLASTGQVEYTLSAAVSTTFFVEFWASTGAFLSVQVGDAAMASSIGLYHNPDNSLSIGFPGAGLISTGLTSASYVGAKITVPAVGSGTTYSATVYGDTGSSYSTGNVTGSTRSAAWTAALPVMLGGAIAAVQVSNESSPTPNNAFVPQAVLDQSLNTLQVIPALSGDPWQIIQQIADAEQGVAGFDESGIFRFTNRKTLKSAGSVRQITSSTSLKALQFTQSQGSTYGSVAVPCDGWTFGKAGLLYTVNGVHAFAPHSTKTWTVNLPSGTLAASVDNDASVLPQGHSTTDGNTWFRASADSGGLNEYRNITVTIAATTPSQLAITVANTGGSWAWLISPAATAGGGTYTDIAAGTPSLWIGGQPVTAADEVTTTFTVNSALPALTLDSNPWIQDDATAAQLAFDLADDLSIAKPDLTNIDIVPDPRLQLADRVQFVDPDTSGIGEYAILWGWSLSLSGDDWSMSIDARAVAAPGQWILGVTGRSELGANTFIY